MSLQFVLQAAEKVTVNSDLATKSSIFSGACVSVIPADFKAPDAKVCFRLGCANIALGHYAEAIKILQFTQSIQEHRDAAVARKLQEAMK